MDVTFIYSNQTNTYKDRQAWLLTDNLILRDEFDRRICSRNPNTVDWDLFISDLMIALLPANALSLLASN